MDSCSSEVAIVVDGEFGDRVAIVCAGSAVWVAGRNQRSVVEELRRREVPYVITVFNYEPALSSAETFASILPVVDEHHGSLSCDPPYHRLIVYGARLNETAKRALESIDFRPEAVTVDGFTATALQLQGT